MRIAEDAQLTVAVIRSKGEIELADRFRSAASRLPGGPEMARLRSDAFGRIAAAGLPHRRVEDWKYTDLRAKMTDAHPPALEEAGRLDEKALAAGLGRALSRLAAVTYVFVNGRLASWDSGPLHADNPNLEITTLGKELGGKGKGQSEALAERLGRPGGPSYAGLDLNLAFVTDGAIVTIPDGAKLPTPLHLVYLSDLSEPRSIATRSLIRLGRGASATIIESHVGSGAAARQTSHVTEIEVGAGAAVEHVKVLAEGSGSQHLGTATVRLAAKSQYRGFQHSEGPALARNQLFVTFQGEDASVQVSGTFLASGHEHIDTTLVIDHAVPRCTSRELFKGVLAGDARGVFQGKVIVRPDAQKTDGKQTTQALLLSETAEFMSKPELEIHADDVVCGHGSTSTELNDDHLFYLRARGIPQEAARAMLIEAFIGEAIDQVGHEALREALRERARAWLDKGGW